MIYYNKMRERTGVPGSGCSGRRRAPVPGARFPGPDHDHDSCLGRALGAAATVCARNGARLTGLRRRVLELVWESHRPIGAYALLAALQRRQSAAPATVYRALEFLQRHGLVHRVASLNAFVGCARPGAPHHGQFLICGTCREAAEFSDETVDAALRDSAERAGFSVERRTLEMIGTCPRCRPPGTRAGET